MPKLLDYIKEKGLSHEDVIKILEESKSNTEVPEDSNPEEEESEVEEEDSTETQEESDIGGSEEKDDTSKLIQVSKKQLSELVDKALEKKLKAIRKTPSKAKTPSGDFKHKTVVQKNMFEEMV